MGSSGINESTWALGGFDAQPPQGGYTNLPPHGGSFSQLPQQPNSAGRWNPPKINPDVIEKHAMTAFSAYDANRNGKLEWHEFYDAFCKLCQIIGSTYPSEEEMFELFRTFDQDFSGVLEYDEFVRLSKQLFGI
eukprot:TRINITY_DN10093_c0_g1_i1.p1 TRINITY_DN10093_c0_g1~~TRINITY_DN10093_c0_g1_i1.p1  ORF type:complete len:144 (+),score=32.30 TRINITY_DN10093_c0_g1_i1:31-432(+)